MRLSNILFAYSEQKNLHSYYLEITFEQKIINKTKFIVLKAKKEIKYYILRLKKKLKNYILIINISLLVTYKENNCRIVRNSHIFMMIFGLWLKDFLETHLEQNPVE